MSEKRLEKLVSEWDRNTYRILLNSFSKNHFIDELFLCEPGGYI